MLILFVVMLVVFLIFDKKQWAVLKKKKFYKRAKDVKSFYLSKKLILNCFEKSNKQFSSYKILQEVDHIVSCVKFNNPILYNIKPDYNLLKKYNLDKKPIFVVSTLTDFDVECLCFAKRFCDFNIVIPQKLLKEKIKIEFSYFVINGKVNKELYNNVMLLNINKSEYFKVEKPFVLNGIQFFMNNKKLPLNNKIINNRVNLLYFDEKITIFCEKILFMGEIYKIVIENKTEKFQTVNMVYEKDFDDKNFIYTKIPYGLNVVSKNFIGTLLCDKKANFFYPKQQSNVVVLPFVKMSKNIKLLPKQKENLMVGFGQCCVYKNLPLIWEEYDKTIKELFNAKIECENKSLMYMFNFYLPNRIVLEEINKQECNFSCYEEAYTSYRKGSISNYEFYCWLKSKYFGIKYNSNFIYVNPIYKGNFDIKLGKIVIKVKHSNNETKYVEIGNVKFFNYSLIPLYQLLNNECITLVL